MSAAPRAIHLSDQAAREAFLAGKWTSITRAGKYPQIDLTEERLDQIVKSYDPSFEMGVVNLDHAPDGPALGKISDVRRLGSEIQVRLDPSQVTDELKAAVTSGKFFRPSAEIYPAFSQLEGSPAYLRGFALLGNKSAQVRGLPRIEFSAGGETYVGLNDAGRGYVCLDGSDPEETITMAGEKQEDKKPAPGAAADVAKLEADKAAALASAKAKDDEIAKLKADLAKKDEEQAALSGRVKAIEEQAARDRVKARGDRIKSGLAALRTAKKISPAQVDIFTAVLNAVPDTAEDVVKLGSGEAAKSHDLIGGIFAALEAGRVLDVPFQDRMPGQPIDAPENLEQVEDEAERLTQAAIAEGKIKKGPEAQTFYLTTAKSLEAKLKATRAH